MGFVTLEMKVYPCNIFFLNMHRATDFIWSGFYFNLLRTYSNLLYYKKF